MYRGFNFQGEALATFCGELEPGRRTVLLGSDIMTIVLNVNEQENCSFRGFHAIFEQVPNP